jgi:lysozyme family protein
MTELLLVKPTMNAAFQIALAFTLAAEGGYSNHPSDNGGPTNFGITMQTLSQFRGAPVGISDIKNISREEVEAIYYKLYWLPMKLNEVNDNRISTVIFDIAVNKGIYGATKVLQRALKINPGGIDGLMGPVTVNALISAYTSPGGSRKLLIDLTKEMQLSYIRLIKSDIKQFAFIDGWFARSHRYLDLFFVT